MKLIARFTAIAVVIALSLGSAPRSSHAATPTAKNCYFVRNHLPCPCPNGQQARALARAAFVTAGALGNAIGTTTSALTHNHAATPRNAGQPRR